MESPRRRMLAVAALLAASVALSTGVAGASVAAPNATRATTASGATSASGATGASKAAVLRGYRTVYAPAQRVPVGWTGSVDGCDPGTESAASRTATIATVNYARSLARLSPVKLDSATSAKAIRAALVYQANGQLEHEIPAGWDCVTAAAKAAGRHSNIALAISDDPRDGLSGARAITAYLDDPGAGNVVVGHRRWVLDPRLRRVGTGSTTFANALWVIGGQASSGFKNPAWVSWPTAGYFPSPLEPDGRWSLSGRAGKNYDFSRAKVTVTDRGGHRLTVKKRASADGYASDTLVFEVAGVKKPTGAAAKVYRVSVSGIRVGGRKVAHRYTVKLVKP
ncbi:CAP domain-containing protein [Galbitalea sp. SE-J8]|uniref:CAP domain-containing protein n=1 Tax=Galbitalea sp. SE-J8 TaxID=3054952 RepID=UPI00259C8846|nr:CAP domain-containing protein [Galbitalea sp. SE-J8]MDM4761557.1 CAP domain-containing protein [Galbitalea sp. SE-J8]